MSYSKTSYDPNTKIWSGPEMPPIYNENVSVGHVVYYQLTMLPHSHILLIDADEDEKYNAEEILSRSISFAVSLKNKFKVSQKDVVGIMSGNSANVMSLFYACLYCGVPVNAVDPSFKIKEVANIWSKTRPKIVFCEGKYYKTVQNVLEIIGLESIIITDGSCENAMSISNLLQSSPNPQFEFFYQPEELAEGGRHTAAILTSSGTSGPPKAVGLSHREILLWFRSRGFSQREIFFNYSPLFWVSGVNCHLNSGVFGSTMVITKKQFTEESSLNTIEKYQINTLNFPPRYISRILAHKNFSSEKLSSVHNVIFAGDNPSAEERRKLLNILDEPVIIGTGYGMTEVSKVTNLAQFNTIENSESVGHVSSNRKIRIINDDGDSLGPGEHGEIIIKTRYPWEGYYNDPQNTNIVHDSEGWYHSGDIGYFDQKGLLYIVGRKKEIIKVSGHQVSPLEIEKLILQLNGISEACVFGLKDIFTHHRLFAVVVRSKLEDQSITAEDISEHLGKEVSAHKRIKPEDIYFENELPRTSTGKIRRKNIIKTFEEKVLI